MNIQVVCRDGPTDDPRLSNRLSSTIKVEGASKEASFFDLIMDSALIVVLGLMALLLVGGILLSIVRKRRLEADIEMIESWGVGGFSEEDEDPFDEEKPQTEETSEVDFTDEVEEESTDIPSMPDLE